MSGPEPHVIYEFGEFRLDASRRLLFAHGTSEPLAIKPKVFETILYFVERPGELLDKDRLMADLWPGLVVEENNLTQVISVVRRVLGEVRGENRYLATVPGRGYRFVADVVRLQHPHQTTIAPAVEAGGGRSRRAGLIALACVLAVAILTYGWYAGWWLAGDTTPSTTTDSAAALPSRTVAVLPFENLSTEASDEFVALGVSESVLHRLASVRDLTLIARTSSFALRDKPADAREIGRTLNARYLVEGSVQRAGEQLRVTAQLIDATTGGHVWSLRFDRGMDDIFAVEDEIAQSVAQALELSLTEEQHPFARFGTDAYLAFLQGRALVASRKMADAERAIERFSRAVELAPDSAAAYAALADAHRHLAYLHEDRSDGLAFMAEAVRKAEPLLAKALQLDDGLGEAYVMRADIKDFKGDLAGAEADYRKGLALSPNYGVGHEHFAEFLDDRLGRFDEALAEFDRARLVDPLTPRNHYRKGLTLLFKGGTAASSNQAEALFLESLRVAPDFHPALLRLAQMRWNSGRFAEAIKLGEQAVAIDPRAQWMRWFLVDFYLELDQVDAARDVLVQQPLPVEPAQWLTVCLYDRELERAAELVRADPNRSAGWFGDYDAAAYSLRDAAQASGQLARAQRELTALRLDPRTRPAMDSFRLATLAQVNHALGDRREAERLAREVLKHEPFGHPTAVALVVLGEHDAALEVLEQGLSTGRRDGWWYTFGREPAFESLRSEPRFQALADKAQAHAAAELKLLEQMRARGEVPTRARKGESSSATC